MSFRSGFVAVLGRPNVGKSSLVNRLVGERVAIVTPRPQTTRRRIAGVLHLEGAQLVFLDTPGVHRARSGLSRWMQAEARHALDGVEAACLVVDAVPPAPGEGDRRAARLVQGAGCPTFLVLNKVDLVPPAERPARHAAYGALAPDGRPFAATLETSAVSGEGLDALVAAVLGIMPEGPAYFPAGARTDQPEQYLAAELVREQALLQLREEVPHALAVTVDAWEPRDNGMQYVGATIHVDRETHKGIVIGRGGAMLRAIGEPARIELARRLGSPVYLELRVKVREGWRDRPGSLETLGYGGRTH